LTGATAEGTFASTESSGAGLVFTAVQGSFSKINKTCFGRFIVAYPSTSSTATAAVALPAACSIAMTGTINVGACSASIINTDFAGLMVVVEQILWVYIGHSVNF
jgi:hypothetical protein